MRILQVRSWNVTITVTIAVIILASSSCARQGSTATKYAIGNFHALPSRIGSEIVTASAISASGRIVLGTSAGRIYTSSTASANSQHFNPFSTSLSGKVLTVKISANGVLIGAISAQDDIAWGQWGSNLRIIPGDDSGSASPRITRVIHQAESYLYPSGSIAFDHQGRHIAFGQSDVRVYDMATRDLVASYKPHLGVHGHGDYGAVSFSSDDTKIVAIADGSVDTWTLADPKSPPTSVKCGCPVSSVSLSGDGRRAAFGTADGHLIVIDSGSGKFLLDTAVTSAPRDSVSAVAISPDGELVVGIASKGLGSIWNGADGENGTVVWRGSVEGSSRREWSFKWRDNVPARQALRAQLSGSKELLLERMTHDTTESAAFGLAPFLTSLVKT